jgi:hypothetical protein
VIAPGVLYRYRVLNEADRPLALQLFTGLGRLGGPLWEQEVRVLLRVSAAAHPALPRVVDGGYDEAANVAFVVTETTTYTLDSPGALAFLHEQRAECVRHLGFLSDALAVLHGQGLMHRNLWPGTIDVLEQSEEGEGLRLRLSRFEMSAPISNLLRGVSADPGKTAAAVRELFVAQGPRALADRDDAIHRLHPVAADVELHQRRVPVTGSERRPAVAERGPHVGDPALG